jgi:hypothetical protein
MKKMKTHTRQSDDGDILMAIKLWMVFLGIIFIGALFALTHTLVKLVFLIFGVEF